jgi:alanine racemase
MISNRTYIEISGDKLCRNLEQLTSGLSKGVLSMAVVKSNAYGHGLLQTAWSLQRFVDWFAVDDIEEAKILRQHGVRNPILILGAVPEEWYQAARSLDLTVTSTSMLSLRWAVNHGVNTHIKLDTGLGRQGFLPGDEYAKLLQYVSRNHPTQITGVYTHFAVADNPAEVRYTMSQLEIFDSMVRELQLVQKRSLLRHVSGTSGALYGDILSADMVRLGIGLYGVWPSPDMADMVPDIKLTPAMNWRTILSEVKSIPKGHSVGYNRTYVAQRKTNIGIVPVGYWHGYPRALSNCGFVDIRGIRAPVIGNISMDMMVVDVTDIPNVLTGETVVLVGGEVSAYELSQLAGMSHYELLTRINPYIERRLV